MDLHVSVRDGAALYTRVVCLTALTLSIVSSQKCTTAMLDPRNVNNYDSSRLVPLRSLDAEANSYRIPGPEQWIFPNLRFTCYGLLTKWIFVAVPGRAAAPSCRVVMETWRLGTTSSINSTLYDRKSTTERNRVTITRDRPIYTYELASPVVVEPGDIVGVVLKRSCIDYVNILSFNTTGTGSTRYSYSYTRAGLDSKFNLESDNVIPQKDVIPLIEALVEPLRGTTTSDSIADNMTTLSASRTTGPEADQSELSGESPATVIAAAIAGATMGVIITAIVCVSVWCIIRHVGYNKKRQESVADIQQQKQEQHHQKREDGPTNVMSMQQNEAYVRVEPRVYHSAISIGIAEQKVQLNQAYGIHGERRVGIEAEETEDDYVIENMYDAKGFEECAKPAEYELPAQQKDGNIHVNVYTEDSNELYEYI